MPTNSPRVVHYPAVGLGVVTAADLAALAKENPGVVFEYGNLHTANPFMVMAYFLGKIVNRLIGSGEQSQPHHSVRLKSLVEFRFAIMFWDKVELRLRADRRDGLADKWQRRIDGIISALENGEPARASMQILMSEFYTAPRLMEPTPTPTPAVNGKPAMRHHRKRIDPRDRALLKRWQCASADNPRLTIAQFATCERKDPGEIERTIGLTRRAIARRK